MELIRAMRFELAATHFEEYWEKFRARGGIVEERVGVGAQEVRSPSVQLRITPLGKVELLSTHDQMLGGPSGQSYLGCIFPADPAYAAAITRDAAKVGDLLRDAGVIGRFALDFVVTRASDSAPWETYAIEINLRKGGTTHPFLTLQFLTGGAYDPERATFLRRTDARNFSSRAIMLSLRFIAVSHRTISSTSSSVGACTSARCARRASSFICSAHLAARAGSA